MQKRYPTIYHFWLLLEHITIDSLHLMTDMEIPTAMDMRK